MKGTRNGLALLFVDLATSVDSTLPNTPVTVLSHKNGAGSNIVIRIAGTPGRRR